MSKSLRTPAFWIALLALLVATSGTAYAAMVVTTKEVKNRSLLGKDLKKDTVTGTEVDESQLQIASANGVVPVWISWTEPPIQPAGGQTILELNGLTVKALCIQSEVRLTASTTSTDAELAWINLDADGAPNGGQDGRTIDDNFTAASGAITLAGGDHSDMVGSLRYVSVDGNTVMAEITEEDGVGSSSCVVSGFAFGQYAAG